MRAVAAIVACVGLFGASTYGGPNVRLHERVGGLAGALAEAVSSADIPPAAQDEGFTPLFNGRDLSGWVNINCAPDTFSVRDGMIYTTGAPICEIRTERMYENFVLEVEWQHLKARGNAGIFVWSDALPARGQPFLRAIEVQVLDGRETAYYTSHGDVFAIHGAKLTPDRPHPAGAMRSLPSEKRANPAGQWNHYRITAKDGTIKLAVNGKEVSGGYDITPRKGYIALESESSPALFRNLRIRELPSSGPVPTEHVASPNDRGFVSLYTGVDFSGWRHADLPAGRWRVNDWQIEAAGAEPSRLVTDASYGDVTLMVDWRCGAGEGEGDDGGAARRTRPAREAAKAGVVLRGAEAPVVTFACDAAPEGAERSPWRRTIVTLRGDRLSETLDGEPVGGERRAADLPARGPVGLFHEGGAMQFANVFVATEAR